MGNVITFIQANWVAILAGLWGLEQTLRILTKLTVWTWDDNLVDVIFKILGQFFPKKP